MEKETREFRDAAREWFHEIGFPPKGLPALIQREFPEYHAMMIDPSTKEVLWEPMYDYDERKVPKEIDFGPRRGDPKVEHPLLYSDELRSVLLRLIEIQGDTEWGSVQQQIDWLDRAPNDHARAMLGVIMWQEGRHGVQMCEVLEPFGADGKECINRLLTRAVGERLIDSFNIQYDDWNDVIQYTFLIDRDGKFQLQMLQHCSYAPLARSMPPMLKEEGFHIGSGFYWLREIMTERDGNVNYVQRYLNKWYPRGLDMFGVDRRKNGEEGGLRTYEWGFKNMTNRQARAGYMAEVTGLVEKLNVGRIRALAAPEENPHSILQQIREHQEPMHGVGPEDLLYVPSDKFDRNIGEYDGAFYDVHGNPIPEQSYQDYLRTVLPEKDPRGRRALPASS